MIPQPPYRRAPITEGVIHLRVGGTATADEQQKVVHRLAKDYPHSKPLQEFNLKIDTTGGEVSVDQRPQGFRLNTDDQADIVRSVFPDGIAIARLAPYQGWEKLKERAQAAHGGMAPIDDAQAGNSYRHPVSQSNRYSLEGRVTG